MKQTVGRKTIYVGKFISFQVSERQSMDSGCKEQSL
jgi:hypothetical protein